MSPKRPHYWTAKEDKVITQLFNLVSTEKLSGLLQVSVADIVKRYQYLKNGKHQYNRKNERVS